MAYGIPPIVSDSGGSPELVEDGTSGMVVTPASPKAIAEAVMTLYKNPELRKAMGKNARKRIDTCFRIEDTIRNTLNMYTDILGLGLRDAPNIGLILQRHLL
jgi:glycosyltransferase involved in cell wall biosynthesis